jgi:glycosyltransferase involved in cell wall biosynthesis
MTRKISFALEHNLGHITHGENLKSALSESASVCPEYFDIPFHNTPMPLPWSRIGAIRSNWTVRASLSAYYSIKSTAGTADAAFFHTQVTSIFSAGLMHRLPSIVSLDATPIQYDKMGSVYDHAPGNSALEALKKRLNIRSFNASKMLVAWSEWAKDSLVADYGISPDKISVIPPGIPLDSWLFPRERAKTSGVRFLFVGGNFARKGGNTLVEAFRAVTQEIPDCFLDIVTNDTGLADLPKNVIIHNGLVPNSPELLQLYRSADIFTFPTRGDCLPLAIMEAMAAGLPVIATDVGALKEAVVDSVTGLIVSRDNSGELSLAMARLVNDHALRKSMGSNGRERAREKFDSAVNYQRLVALLLSIADH